MGIRRAVPDLETASQAGARGFWVDVVGFDVGMDLGWVTTFTSPDNPTAQVTVLTHDASAPVVPQVSVEVSDVDEVHRRAVAAGREVVHPLTDEPWGVRRFFVRDPDGHVINVLQHIGDEDA